MANINVKSQSSAVLTADTQVVAGGERGMVTAVQAIGGTNTVVKLYSGTSASGTYLGEVRIGAIVATVWPSGNLPEYTNGLFAAVSGSSPEGLVWFTH